MRRPPRLMPALITPFAARGEIDLDSRAHNMATVAGHGPIPPCSPRMEAALRDAGIAVS